MPPLSVFIHESDFFPFAVTDPVQRNHGIYAAYRDSVVVRVPVWTFITKRPLDVCVKLLNVYKAFMLKAKIWWLP